MGAWENQNFSLWVYQNGQKQNSLGKQDLKIYIVATASGERRTILKSCLSAMKMAEAVSLPPAVLMRAAHLVVPARTFLLEERNP